MHGKNALYKQFSTTQCMEEGSNPLSAQKVLNLKSYQGKSINEFYFKYKK